MKTKNIFLISALALSGLWLALLLLSLFKVFDLSSVMLENFNYIMAFALIIICLAIFTISLFIENKKFLDVPEWISCAFYVAFFLFTNVYYLFGLYNIIYTNLLFYASLSVLISILSVSIYYNCLKNEVGQLKNKISFTGFLLFCISTAMSVCVELVIMFVKFCFNTNINLTSHALASWGILLLVATVFALLFQISISGDKKFVNACLIKTKLPDVKTENTAEQKRVENKTTSSHQKPNARKH